MDARSGERFGELLRQHRLAARLTQEELAERAGVSARSVVYLEHRVEQVPRTSTRELLAGALGLEGREYAAFTLAARRPAAVAAALEDATTLPRTLPESLTSFVGREREIELAGEMLQDDVRLLTLTGPGGVGKTRLALEVARRAMDHVLDGVWLVSLAPIADPSLVPIEIARILGVRETSGKPILESLKAHLLDKRALLVLDNFEQVVEAALPVADLLAACSGLRVLVTSRALLRVQGEHAYPVHSLDLPDAPPVLDAGQLSRNEAVRLFYERARALDPAFVITGENAPAVAQICRRLDGLPLAIEFAAARVKVLPPADLLSRLDNRLELLVGGARDLPSRQRTLRATLEWSHELLDEKERRLFRRLGVFSGGWTLEAAEAVCAADGALYVLDGVESLLEKSLVQRAQAEAGDQRFGMLETVREYAVERLEQSGEAKGLRHKHAEYFLALAEQAVAEQWGPRHEESLGTRRREYLNLRAALGWYTGRGEAERALRLANALLELWWEDGLMTEGREWQRRALATPGSVPASVRTATLGSFLWRLRQMGDEAAARAYAEEELAQDRERGNEEGVAHDLLYLAEMALERREYPLAATLAGESAPLFRNTGKKNGLCLVLNIAGVVADELGDHERARSIHEEALALGRESEDEGDKPRAIRLLGWNALLQGDIGRATELYEESRVLNLGIGGRRHTGGDEEGLGYAALLQGDYPLAVAHFEERLALARDLSREGSNVHLAHCLRLLAWAVCYAGEVPRARELQLEGLAVAQELGDERGVAASLEGLAAVAAAQGNPQDAARIFGAAERLRVAIGIPADKTERLLMDRCLLSARGALEPEAFEEAHSEGRAMTKDEAIAYALSVT